MNSKEYWDNYYIGKLIDKQSSFCDFVLNRDSFSSIIDFGCGDFRDTTKFLEQEKTVLACDFSNSILNKPAQPNLTISQIDFSLVEPRLFY